MTGTENLFGPEPERSDLPPLSANDRHPDAIRSRVVADFDEGRRLRDRGQLLAACNPKRSDALDLAREAAWFLARRDGTTTADAVRWLLGDEVWALLGPAAGSIFKSREWVFTGARRPSTLPSNHAREVKVWKLDPEAVFARRRERIDRLAKEGKVPEATRAEIAKRFGGPR